ncbi:hypothetical protein [Pseudophaeobacter sp.]|uniref:hypothetical protein n=2 Tax=Pseudophaeobacter sp. TaxID=1971739 RepID=UPI0040586908
MMGRKGRMMIADVKLLVGVVATAGLLAGCGGDKDLRPAFDGVPFRTNAKVVDKKVTRALFEAEVWNIAASPLGAREAVRFAGTTYCIENYGTSKIEWSIDLDDPEVPLPQSGGNALVQGTCET